MRPTGDEVNGLFGDLPPASAPQAEPVTTPQPDAGLLSTPGLLELLTHAQQVDWRTADEQTAPLLPELLRQAGDEITRLLALVRTLQGPEVQAMTPEAARRFVLLTHFTLAQQRLIELKQTAERGRNPTAARAFDTAVQVLHKAHQDARSLAATSTPRSEED